jgi:hypothetical protein
MSCKLLVQSLKGHLDLRSSQSFGLAKPCLSRKSRTWKLNPSIGLAKRRPVANGVKSYHKMSCGFHTESRRLGAYTLRDEGTGRDIVSFGRCNTFSV